jgi:hypothetical protein
MRPRNGFDNPFGAGPVVASKPTVGEAGSIRTSCRLSQHPLTQETTMHIRFVTKTIHAWLDYPVALSLFALPFLLGLGADNPWARWLSPATGVAAFILTLLTNHQTGLIKVIPYWLHVAVDRLVGVVFIVATFALGFHGLDMWYYLANAVAVLLATTVLNAPEPVTDAVGLAHA